MYALRLRELRDKHKLTQQEIASRLQLSSDAYSLYELGKRQMNYETLCLLADMYDISIDYLLGRCDFNAVALEDEEHEIIKQYRALDQRGQETIKANLAFETSRVPQNKVLAKSAI